MNAEYNALAAAAAWQRAGTTVIPVRPDGSKGPAVEGWRHLYNADPGVDTSHLFRTALGAHGPDVGIAVLCGRSSGNLEMVEIEGPPEQAAALMQQLGELAGRAGLAELWQRLANGYVEVSPKGGVHFLYRVNGADVAGNKKLARRPAHEHELNDAERRHLANRPGHLFPRTTIETRGQGGYVIVAPSPAACSAVDGPRMPWQHLRGHPGTIPTLTAAEVAELHNIARGLDTYAAAAGAVDEQRPQQTRLPLPAGGDERPGDRYAAEHTWQDVLGPHGWRKLYEHGGKTYWCRPGKTHGISATTTDAGPGDPGGLWVFSTSTTFDSETLYTKFGAYAHLEHGDDHSAAARALAGADITPVTPLRPMHELRGMGPGPAGAAHEGSRNGGTAADVAGPGDPGTDSVPPVSVSTPPVRPPSWSGISGEQLVAVLDGSWQQPRADLLPVAGGHGLLYRGRTHALYGESGSGKSMVAQSECARILAATDERVAYVDYESDMPTVVRRLYAMGAPRHKIAAQFVYIKPESTPYTPFEAEQFQALLGTAFALIVIDGVTDALMYEQMKFGGPGVDPNTLVTGWARRVLDPLAIHTGAAVVTIDHIPKNADKTSFAIGAQAKRSVLSGAAYAVDVWDKAPLGRGKIGKIALRPTKDRDGGIETWTSPSGSTTLAAVIVFDSTDPDGSISVDVQRPEFAAGGRKLVTLDAATEDARKERERDGVLMAGLCTALASMPGQATTSKAELARAMGYKDGAVFSAGKALHHPLTNLVALGHVAINHHGSGKPDSVHLVTPYVYKPDVEPESTPAPASAPPAAEQPATAPAEPVNHPVNEPVNPVHPDPVHPVRGQGSDRVRTGTGTLSDNPVPDPVLTPVRSTGEDRVRVDRVEGRQDHERQGDQEQDQEQRPSATTIAAPPAVFRAPIAAGPPPPNVGPIRTRLKPGEAPCEICGLPVDPQLVIDGAGRHLGC